MYVWTGVWWPTRKGNWLYSSNDGELPWPRKPLKKKRSYNYVILLKILLCPSYTLHELRNQNVSKSSVQSKQLFCFVHGQDQKSKQNHTTKQICQVSLHCTCNYVFDIHVDIHVLKYLISRTTAWVHELSRQGPLIFGCCWNSKRATVTFFSNWICFNSQL